MAVLFHIIALILALPFQTASLAKVMSHLNENRHVSYEHGHDHHSDHGDSAPSHSPDAEQHSDGDHGPIHSHAKELSAALAPVGVLRNESSVELPATFICAIITFEFNRALSRTANLMVFRPPIDA